MFTARIAAVAAAALAALGLWRASVYVAALHRAMPTRSAWPVMRVARAPDATAAGDALTQLGVPVEPPARGDERTAALALRALSGVELEQLQLALDELAVRLETQADRWSRTSTTAIRWRRSRA